MRAGGFTIQQALSSDAASIIKQAVTLAHRRGHAQVTPLHVANTMLSSTTGLLRTACLRSQSHSHPLQCKALELCFNVALNRMPTSSSNPMPNTTHSSQHPSISNALVAAFKRAQAHQRRGTIENQQQPVLAVKIELEQLTISILDDPSVSRVMREAGFSSTQVKTNVEQVVSLELASQTHPPVPSKDPTNRKSTDNLVHNQVEVMNEDVMWVIENLLNEKRSRNFVVVGECVATIEGVVGKVMEKVDKREVPEALKDVKFISLPLVSFGQLSRRDVEQKLGELSSLVKGFVQRGVVLYLGDLKWITEFRVSSWGHGRGYYCPIEHLIIELGRLVCGINDTIGGKLWVMAISSFQTYMKCRNGNPSLEAIWKLHPLTIPAGSLSLSLVPQSDIQSECGSLNDNINEANTQMICGSGEEKQLTCCVDCSLNFESEAKSLTSSSLPAWLCDAKVVTNNQDLECVSVKELCKKWNSICTSIHRNKSLFQRSLSFSSVSPSSQDSCFSYNQENPSSNRNSKVGLHVDFTALERNLGPYNLHDEGPYNLHDSTPNSASSSVLMESEYVQKFREFNGKNLRILCNALEEKVPRQKDIVPDIAGTILKCRSRMLRRKEKQNNDEPKEETWLLFQGISSRLKEKIARELAKIIFGSYLNFTTIALRNFSTSPRGDSTDEPRNKRPREEQSCSYLERFAEAVSVNPHRVFLVEDLEQVDYCSQMGIKQAIERGKLTHSNGEHVGFRDAIIVLSCESFSLRSRTCSPLVKQKVQEEDEESPIVSLDLNVSFDEEHEESMSMDDIGLFESVDKCINFNIEDLSL